MSTMHYIRNGYFSFCIAGRFRFDTRRSYVSNSSATGDDAEGQLRFHGKYKWWEKPVYVAPHVHPLEEGPDFSFVDGRPSPLATRSKINRKLEQIQLGRKIVKYLSDMNEIKRMSIDNELMKRATESESMIGSRPRAKSNIWPNSKR